MKKIATHNSITGERGKGFLSWIVTLFSRCQSKTIEEQYKAGCRYFDLRVRKNKVGLWEFAHGLWVADVQVYNILRQLNVKSSTKDPVFISLTYEGKDNESIINFAEEITRLYKNLYITTVNVKYPEWKTLKVYNDCPVKADYTILDKRNWRTFLPIPWLWNKLRKSTELNENTFTMIDFL